MLSIVTNIVAVNAQRQFNIVNKSKAKTTEKLSSGYRINRAADDAAGLAISEKLRRQIRGLNQGANNIQDGISLTQVADGALNEDDAILHRMNELSVKAANGTNTPEDRRYIQQEIENLKQEIDRIAYNTAFNEEVYPLLGKYSYNETTRLKSITAGVTNTVRGDVSVTLTNYTGYLVNNYQPAKQIYDSINKKYVDYGDKVEVHLVKAESSDGVVNYLSKNTILRKEPTEINKIFDSSVFSTLTLDDLTSVNYNFIAIDKNVSSQTYTVYLSNQADAFGYAHYVDVRNGIKSTTCDEDYGMLQYVKKEYEKEADESGKKVWIQASGEPGDGWYIYLQDGTAQGIGVDDIDVSTVVGAEQAIEKIKGALGKIAECRTYFGSSQNRMEHAYNQNMSTSENTSAAESRIRDTDMAKEIVEMNIYNILEQAGVSVLSQANQNNDVVLSLLQ